MKLIHKIQLICILLLTAIISSSCTSSANKTNFLHVYNWGDYMDTEIIEEFEKETGIKVVYDTFDTNETMYAKLKPGNAIYDIVIPSDYMIERMVKEDMLAKIDMNNVPNFKNIDDRFKSLYYDTNNEYTVAYMWGTVGILYNKTMVDEPVDSFSILWNEKYKGEIFMYDSVRDTFTAALKKLNYSLNTRDVNELSKAKEELIKQKPLVQAYEGDPVKDKMIGEEGALAIVYSGDAMYCQMENENLGYAIPKEGSNLWYDGIVIPKNSKNKENAEKFINFLCKPEIAARNSEYIGYTTANKGALEFLPDEMKNSPTYWPSDEELIKCESFYDLGDFTTEYDKAWTEILAK